MKTRKLRRIANTVIVVMVTLLFLTINLGMADEKPMSKMEEAHKKCSLLGELANAIMTARQVGVPMPQAMNVAFAVPEQWAQDLTRKMVSDAYEKPQYNTPSIRQQEIQGFSDLWYGTCMKVHQDKE